MFNKGEKKDEYKSIEIIKHQINELLMNYHKFVTKILIAENIDTQKLCEEPYIEVIKLIISNNPIYSQLLELINRDKKSLSVYYLNIIILYL